MACRKEETRSSTSYPLFRTSLSSDRLAKQVCWTRCGHRRCLSYAFKHWSRIVDYRYSLDPLSTIGSLKGDGGRFNIGAELSPGTFTPFPALYVAEDYETAFGERFGRVDKRRARTLSTHEFALRVPASFTQVRLNGNIEQVIDVGDLDSLKPFIDILRTFPVPRVVLQTARQLGLRQTSWLIRSASLLQRKLLHPNWRLVPAQFDLPANSQIFARLAVAAGLHGNLEPLPANSRANTAWLCSFRTGPTAGPLLRFPMRCQRGRIENGSRELIEVAGTRISA